MSIYRCGEQRLRASSFAGQTQTVQAAEDGSWRIELSPLQAEGTGNAMIVESGEQRKEFRNLLVGEV